MAAWYRLAAILFLITWFSALCSGCDVEEVAVYNVTLRTFWSEETFPKDYPLYRPKAQWSPIFGQSHNSSYRLYHLGNVARDSVRKFSQLGILEDLIEEGDKEPSVYDQFSAPAIGKGVGETANIVFLDGEHSLLSMICRIVPSPDWFVGVSSVNLCNDMGWIEQIILDLEPLDAGAASGLTFTAPRWETSPPEPVTVHGPRTPNHPAAGFFYPELRELPTIAKVEITKVKEYSTVELNNLARQELKASLKLKDKRKGFSKSRVSNIYRAEEESFTDSYIEKLKQLEEEPVGTPSANNPDDYVEVVTKAITTTTTAAEFDTNLRSMDDVVLAVAHGRKLGLGKHLPRHFRSRLHRAVNKLTPNDCLVSEWSDWTSCSVTCGFGDKFRTRKVLRQPTLAGRQCPQLTERTHCGNVNSCYEIKYFDW